MLALYDFEQGLLRPVHRGDLEHLICRLMILIMALFSPKVPPLWPANNITAIFILYSCHRISSNVSKICSISGVRSLLDGVVAAGPSYMIESPDIIPVQVPAIVGSWKNSSGTVTKMSYSLDSGSAIPG